MDSLTIIFILNGVFFISFFVLKNIYIPLGLSLLTLFFLLFISKHQKIPSINPDFKLPSLAFNNNQYLTAIACLIIFFILEKFIGFKTALLVAFFIFSHQTGLNSRISFFIALILLVITTLLTAGGNGRIAEDSGILVYYFLVIGVVWQIIELRNVKAAEDINAESDEVGIKVITKKSVLQRHNSSYNYIFLKRAIVIIGVFVISCFVIFLLTKLFTKQTKLPLTIKPVEKKQIATPVITPIFKPVTPASLVILNATDSRGLAGSYAAMLRKDGWQKEFDISTGNYMGDEILSANILKYTKNFEDKVPLIEQSLNIRVTPILLKEATQEAELTLILGK